MIELQGKFCKDCKIFTDNVEQEAIQTIYSLINSPEFKDSKVRCMPDTHQGKGIVIGFTAPAGKYVNPDHVGCDIGCTVSSILFSDPLPEDKYALFEHRVKLAVPQGMKIQEQRQFDVKEFLRFLRTELQRAYQGSKGLTYIPEFNNERDLEEWLQDVKMDVATFYKSIGTLGGGNHFIEYDKGENSQAFTVHTGSRNLGLKVWKKWSDLANSTKISKAGERNVIDQVKSKNQDKTKLKEEISKAIEEYKLTLHPGYLEGENLRSYLTDMVICQAYAKFNHKIILEKAEKIHSDLVKGSKVIDKIQTTHNYIDFDTVDGTPMIRKGAVRANEGEVFLLPFNMKDGIAICKGKGNSDWNYSAPHGAGRIMSRAKAKETLKIKDFEKVMEGIYSTTVNRSTIDESPMAYKSKEEIIELIDPTCEIIQFLKPVINIKAGAEDEIPSWKEIKEKKKRG